LSVRDIAITPFFHFAASFRRYAPYARDDLLLIIDVPMADKNALHHFRHFTRRC